MEGARFHSPGLLMRNELLSLAPEFRRNPVTGSWVVVAPERSQRPMALTHAEPHPRANGDSQPCQFCPGQEADTPNEVLAYREQGSPIDGPGWRLRVVPNKFPAVRPLKKPGTTSNDLFAHASAFGRHEVLIACADHHTNPAALSDEQFCDMFRAYRERLVAHDADESLVYAAVFQNVGAEAGASVGHTHSQIIATPIVPDGIRHELESAESRFAATHRCVFCDIVTHEQSDEVRIVAESANFLAVTAYAPRFAYEMWVLPRSHASGYESASPSQLEELALLMKRLVHGLDKTLDSPAYNWFLHTAPLRSPELPHFHWHFEIMPRTSRPAGFEWGFDCHIVAVSPEQAARELRKQMH